MSEILNSVVNTINNLNALALLNKSEPKKDERTWDQAWSAYIAARNAGDMREERRAAKRLRKLDKDFCNRIRIY